MAKSEVVREAITELGTRLQPGARRTIQSFGRMHKAIGKDINVSQKVSKKATEETSSATKKHAERVALLKRANASLASQTQSLSGKADKLAKSYRLASARTKGYSAAQRNASIAIRNFAKKKEAANREVRGYVTLLRRMEQAGKGQTAQYRVASKALRKSVEVRYNATRAVALHKKALGKWTTAQKASSKQAVMLKQQLLRTNRAYQATSAQLSVVRGKLGWFRRGAAETAAVLKDVASVVAKYWRVAFLGAVGGALALFGGAMLYAIKVAKDFQWQMAKVATIMNERDIPLFGKLEVAVRNVTKEFGFASKDASQAMYQILSAQIDAAGASEVLRVAARGARVGFTDLATAADALTSVMKSYQLEAREASRVMDVLMMTVRKGKLEFSDLARQIGRVAPTAAGMDLELEELAAMFAALTGAGQRAGIAATSIGAILRDFLKPTVDAQTLAWEKWGILLGTTQVAQEGLITTLKKLSKASASEVAILFPQIRGLRGINALRQRLGETEKTLAEIRRSSNTVVEAQLRIEDRLAFQIKRTKQVLLDFFRALGKQTETTLGQSLKTLNKYLERLTRVAKLTTALKVPTFAEEAREASEREYLGTGIRRVRIAPHRVSAKQQTEEIKELAGQYAKASRMVRVMADSVQRSGVIGSKEHIAASKRLATWEARQREAAQKLLGIQKRIAQYVGDLEGSYKSMRPDVRAVFGDEFKRDVQMWEIWRKSIGLVIKDISKLGNETKSVAEEAKPTHELWKAIVDKIKAGEEILGAERAALSGHSTKLREANEIMASLYKTQADVVGESRADLKVKAALVKAEADYYARVSRVAEILAKLPVDSEKALWLRKKGFALAERLYEIEKKRAHELGKQKDAVEDQVSELQKMLSTQVGYMKMFEEIRLGRLEFYTGDLLDLQKKAGAITKSEYDNRKKIAVETAKRLQYTLRIMSIGNKINELEKTKGKASEENRVRYDAIIKQLAEQIDLLRRAKRLVGQAADEEERQTAAVSARALGFAQIHDILQGRGARAVTPIFKLTQSEEAKTRDIIKSEADKTREAAHREHEQDRRNEREEGDKLRKAWVKYEGRELVAHYAPR